MKVFKFGGASVKDADSVKNAVEILKGFKGEKLLVVISAMGKTTNALEKVVNDYFFSKGNAHAALKEVRDYHQQIMEELFSEKANPVFDKVNNFFVEADWMLDEKPQHTYNFVYDQIVSLGELISTCIVSAYLKQQGCSNIWLDVRDVLMTDNTYREAKAMYIWKDVPGVLNADPKFYKDAQKLDQISYHDAIELAYYGATVIHPKTIKPLENKNIPLFVKSFLKPEANGTSIRTNVQTKPLIPSYIFKNNQVLISIAAKDFSFIAEDNLSRIFALFAGHGVKINLMQNSAISFSVCVDNDSFKIPALIEALQKDYKIRYNEDLMLYTIRHYYQNTIDAITSGKEILLEQRSRNTAQFVLRDSIK